MHRFTRDGAPVPNNVRARPLYEDDRRGRYGVVRGYIQRTVYPDDPDNLTGFLEYIVTINGADYYGCLDISHSGGIFNSHTRVRKDIDNTSFRPSGIGEDFEEKKDGESVWCLFVGGNIDVVLIIGSSPHPRQLENPDFIKPTSDKGTFERYEINGMQFLVEKDTTFSVKHVGSKKSLAGSTFITSADQTKSEIKFKGDGSLLTASLGESVNVEFNGIAKTVNVSTPTASISIDGTGKTKIEGSGGKLTLAANQVALGSSAGELLAEIDKLLQQMDTLTGLTGLQAETHTGNLGYPTGTPINTAIYSTINSQILLIKNIITLIKGAL